jgi:hypothetical protein
MIQRIQSIWLLLASAASFAGMKLAFYTGNKLADAQNPQSAKSFDMLNGMSNIFMNINTVAVGLLCFITIFLYGNRRLQLKFCAGIIILESILIMHYQMGISNFVEGTYAIGAVLQPLILFLILLAIKGINKDNKIIEESDRLR